MALLLACTHVRYRCRSGWWISNKCSRDQWEAHLTLSHGNARAIPEALLGLHLLVVIMPAGAQGSSQLILVLCQSLQYKQQPSVQY